MEVLHHEANGEVIRDPIIKAFAMGVIILHSVGVEDFRADIININFVNNIVNLVVSFMQSYKF